MTHTFYYGNIFEGELIRDALELENIVGIKDGSEQDPLKVGDLIYPKKEAIEKYVGRAITLNLICYVAFLVFLWHDN